MKTIKNPILLGLIIIFSFFTILDIITSYYISAGETNPIYLLTKSIFWLAVFKIGLVIGAISIYRHNTYPSNFTYYLLLAILVLGNVLLLIALIGNIMGMLEPQLVENASQLTTGQKAKAYFSFIFVIYLLPLFFSVFTFKLYEWSIKNITLEKDILEKAKFKNRWWWKFK